METDNTVADCDEQAKQEFEKKKGIGWEKVKRGVWKIFGALKNGTRIKISRKQRIDVCLLFNSGCTEKTSLIKSMNCHIQ